MSAIVGEGQTDDFTTLPKLNGQCVDPNADLFQRPQTVAITTRPQLLHPTYGRQRQSQSTRPPIERGEAKEMGRKVQLSALSSGNGLDSNEGR